MQLEPVTRRSLGDQVFDQLSAQILHGELTAGAALPSERSLVELLGVNRQAVREAIKRLEQAGLVDVHHGGATIVTSWRHRAGLDLLTKLVVTADGRIDPAVVRSIMEFRATVGPEVAARCAERAVPDVKAELAALAERYLAVDGDITVDELSELDTALWAALVDGSDNIAFRLAFNALRRETSMAEVLVQPLLVDEVGNVELHVRLLDQVMTGDAAGARSTATALLAIGTAAMAKAMAGASSTQARSQPTRRGASR